MELKYYCEDFGVTAADHNENKNGVALDNANCAKQTSGGMH